MDAKQFVSQMTLEEKTSLLSGSDFWHTTTVDRLGLESIMVADGPHGLRKQDWSCGFPSVPATCFPSACAMAASFDENLMEEVGQALGEEALDQEISVILGPGINIKRSPLGGRNFEYFSEDPYLSGKLASAWIKGVQKKGVGTSLKHFAANSQEYCRMVSDSVVDERALREIYLSAFEIAVKEAKPWTVMCSYNLVNGTYASENRELLTDILRIEWGFEGLAVSDWGAINHRATGVEAGLDLEMPYSGGYNDNLARCAVHEGRLDEAAVDQACERIVALVHKASERRSLGAACDYEAHHVLARKAAAESCVLLKNQDSILPLKDSCSLAVIGAFAQEPRFQGTGSSKVYPKNLDNAFSELQALGFDASYEPGYNLDRNAQPNKELIESAVNLAKTKDIALVFVGLPDELESEGFDRKSLAMPQAHTDLIEAVANANPHTVVVLSVGSPVETSWSDKVAGIVVCFLGGEAGGGGLADVVSGKVCPSAKLPETWPASLTDTPSYSWFPSCGKRQEVNVYNDRNAEYRESIFVGYRYFDTASIAPSWCFGYGLSYTEFTYSDLVLSSQKFNKGKLKVSFTLTNTGQRAGAEIVQLYVGFSDINDSAVFRVVKELKGFKKVYLEAGQSTIVEFDLDERAFSYFNTAEHKWAWESGSYRVSLGASSRDIRLSATVSVSGDGLEEKLSELKTHAPVYFQLPQKTPVFNVPDNQFAALLAQSGLKIPQEKKYQPKNYDHNIILADVQHKLLGRVMVWQARTQAQKSLSAQDIEGMIEPTVYETPFRSMMMMSNGAISGNFMNAMLDLLNGKFFSGLRRLLFKR